MLGDDPNAYHPIGPANRLVSIGGRYEGNHAFAVVSPMADPGTQALSR